MRAFIFPLFIPVGVNYQTRRLPVVTFTIMGLCVAVHLVAIFNWLGGGAEAELGFAMNMGFVTGRPTLHGVLTHMFTHAGIFHLLGNMVYLFLFGSCVEDLLGRFKFTVFYLIGGFIALAVYATFAPPYSDGDALIPLVGASGAISACMGGFLVVLHHREITIRWIVIFFFRVFSGEWHLAAKLVMSFWFLMDVWGMISSSGSSGGGVAFSAHVGGFLGGAAMMAVAKATKNVLSDEDVERGQGNGPGPGKRRQIKPATIYLWLNNEQTGPFTRAQILNMVQLGTIESDTMYWEDGMEEWRTLDYM